MIRFTSLPTLAFLLLLSPLPGLAQTELEYQGPDWYQVEVIVFSQQDLFNAETPRRDISLTYPENWVMLLDPEQPDAKLDPAEQIDVQSNEPATNNSLALLSAAMHDQTATEPAPIEAADLEPVVIDVPFEWLADEARALNPDSFSLTRAPGYRVLYHQAWRQPIASREEAPWIIIKGGKTFGERHELEGSIRLYQSRFLHFQSNLWKARYQQIEAPLIQPPAGPVDLTRDLTTPETEEPWPTIPVPPEPPEPPQPEQPEVEITDPLQLLIFTEPRFPVDQSSLVNEPIFEVTQVVALEQSQRVSTKQVYYLDHPSMGVLVLIKKHQPTIELPTVEAVVDDTAIVRDNLPAKQVQ